MAVPTVITDVSWNNGFPSRLLVNGAPVYAWIQPLISLTHGILVPAGAVLTVEAYQGTMYSLAGYTL